MLEHLEPREPSGAELTARLRERERRAKIAADRPALERLWDEIQARMAESQPR